MDPTVNEPEPVVLTVEVRDTELLTESEGLCVTERDRRALRDKVLPPEPLLDGEGDCESVSELVLV